MNCCFINKRARVGKLTVFSRTRARVDVLFETCKVSMTRAGQL